MEIQFKPDLEDKLNRIASQTGRPAGQIVEELVQTYVDHDQWFRREVGRGLAQLDRDEFVENDEVMARIEQMFRS
jgi:predicted transcriptional regulator